MSSCFSSPKSEKKKGLNVDVNFNNQLNSSSPSSSPSKDNESKRWWNHFSPKSRRSNSGMINNSNNNNSNDNSNNHSNESNRNHSSIESSFHVKLKINVEENQEKVLVSSPDSTQPSTPAEYVDGLESPQRYLTRNSSARSGTAYGPPIVIQTHRAEEEAQNRRRGKSLNDSQKKQDGKEEEILPIVRRRSRQRILSPEDEQFERLMETSFANKPFAATLNKRLFSEPQRKSTENGDVTEIFDIPVEIKLLIFSFLDAFSLAQASSVCREWRYIMMEKDLWKGKRKALMSRRLSTIQGEDDDAFAFRNSYRIVLVGAGGVGKSSLTVRFVVGRFVEKYDPTIEDAYRIQIAIDGETANLDIIDTAGPEEYSALRDQYIKLGAGFIIVYSITSIHSSQAVAKLRSAILRIKGLSEDNGSCYDVPIILVGNKLDLSSERSVSYEEGQSMANKYSNFSKNFFEVSARSNTNVSEIFCEIVRQIDTVQWRKNNQTRKLTSPKTNQCFIM
eukprot:TRINITY_DN4904_c0_g1_i3.p1 TRINITY_DN4904_c0_g1~~TRINITY_DN4904_c0_g1_i3.p1  ORF type:complete len:505 (+),score=101.83 TRINITY_DN4904_c0_g1_i3:313-1827(+)